MCLQASSYNTTDIANFIEEGTFLTDPKLF